MRDAVRVQLISMIPERFRKLTTAAIAIVVLATLCARFAFLRFGLEWDEMLSYWVASASDFTSIRERATRFQGQSSLYFLLIAAVANYVGSSEIALRAPSVLGFLVILVSTWMICRDRFGANVAWLAVVFLLALDEFPLIMQLARPYSPAAAAALAATALMWRGEPRLLRQAGAVCLMMVAILFHYLSLFVIPLQLYLVATALPGRIRLQVRTLYPLLSLFALVPLLLKYRHLAPNMETYFGAPAIPWGAVFSVLLPINMLILVAVALGVFVIGTWASASNEPRQTQLETPIAFLVLGWILPILVLGASCLVFGAGFFTSRYISLFTPYLAIGVAAGIAKFSIRGAEAATILALACFALAFAYLRKDDPSMQWRDGLALARSLQNKEPDSLVLFAPAVLEAGNVEWFRDPVKQDYLLAPTNYYRLDSRPILVPPSYEEAALGNYFREAIEKAVAANRRTWILVYGSYAEPEFFVEGYKVLRGRLEAKSYARASENVFHRVIVSEFRKVEDR